MYIDDYENRISNIVNAILKNVSKRLHSKNFKGVFLYNCGIPEGNAISDSVIKSSNKHIKWEVKEIEISDNNIEQLVRKLPKKRGKEAYLLIDILSEENPIPNIQNKIMYTINIGNY